MTPIMCCGETLAEREAGETESKVLGQIEAGLAGRTNEQIASLVIAYEPIWAIGTGKTATADDAQTVCAAIRGKVRELTDDATADAVRIQYGGSVKGANADRTDGATRHRRRPRRWGQPRPRRVRQDRPVRQLIVTPSPAPGDGRTLTFHTAETGVPTPW